ncbi:MAG: hypothetical protein U9Q30_00615 [Campylobacterota bacterium]|nr:hypothetical protein [Campylobacterota bacterium]
MFLLIPGIIIFFTIAYIQFNPDIHITLEISLYLFMVLTILTSYKIYSNIKKNLNTQEKNKIRIEINKLIIKIGKEKDDKKIKSYQHKLNSLRDELEEKK